jgi:TRAP-type mannitol/chloroaromatic compound transport system substrate-binding protein
MDRRTFIRRAGFGAAAVAAGPLAPAVWAKGERIRWRMVTSWPPGMPILQTGAEHFAQRVASLSDGRLSIQVFAGGELVPPLGVFDAVSQGTVQCGHSASYYWAGKSPAAQWFTCVPFGLNAQGMNAWLYSGNGLSLWEEVYAPFDLIPRPAGNTGAQMGGWFNKEIRSLADLNGLKMRMPGLGGKILAKAGGAVVLLPASDIYTALERGTIDATEWVGPAHDCRMGFQRVAKYYYSPGWHEPGSVLELIVSRKAYEGLPADLKAVVDTAAAELNVTMLSEFEAENARALNGLIKEQKVSLRTFPPEIMKELRGIAQDSLEEEAAKDVIARKVHEDFKAFRGLLSEWSRVSEREYYTI